MPLPLPDGPAAQPLPPTPEVEAANQDRRRPPDMEMNHDGGDITIISMSSFLRTCLY
jgi:hypothetical protein